MNEQGVMVVLDATRSRMQIKMWILFVKNMFAGSALAERFCCRTTNAFAFQSSLCSTSLYFRPPLAMIYGLDLVWRFSQKTWSTGISAGKHDSGDITWVWMKCWREHQIGWLALEPKLKTATELQVNHCRASKKGTSSWPCSLNVKFALHIVHKIYKTTLLSQMSFDTP